MSTRRSSKCPGFSTAFNASLRGVLAGVAGALSADPRAELFGDDLIAEFVLRAQAACKPYDCAPSILVYEGPIVRFLSQQELLLNGPDAHAIERTIHGKLVRQRLTVPVIADTNAVLAVRVYSEQEDKAAHYIRDYYEVRGSAREHIPRPKGWAPLKQALEPTTGQFVFRDLDDAAPLRLFGRSSSFTAAGRTQFYRIRLGELWVELQFTQLFTGQDAVDYDAAVRARRQSAKPADHKRSDKAAGRKRKRATDDDDGPDRRRRRVD